MPFLSKDLVTTGRTLAMSNEPIAFGQELRKKRTAAKISLRRFAELLGVSATYLSQVEQCNASPPTAERIQHMASLLNTAPDPLLALAGRVPEELTQLIHRHPIELPRLIRLVAEWDSSEIAALADRLSQPHKH